MDCEYVRQALFYDKETGVLTWKKRPISHFPDEPHMRSWNTRYAGKVAGTRIKDGRIQIHIDGGSYLGHRIAWLIITGSWPNPEVDHKDLNHSNNKWSNLREATRVQNNYNRRKSVNKTSKFKGVSWHNVGKKWQAHIISNGNHRYLGLFDSEEMAYDAYCCAAKELHGEFARVN